MDTSSSAHSTYSITINEHTSKSMGVTICTSQKSYSTEYVVSHVVIDSIGDTMGIAVGDRLMTINDVQIQQILHPPSRLHNILSEHKAPFIAKFMKPAAVRGDYQMELDPLLMTLSSECEDDPELKSMAISPQSESNKLSDVPAYCSLTQSSTPFLEGHGSCANAEEDEGSDAFSFENETHSDHEMMGKMKELEILHRVVTHSTDKMSTMHQSVHFDALKVFPSLSMLDCNEVNNIHTHSSSVVTLPSVPAITAPITPTGNVPDIPSDRLCVMSTNGLSSGYHEWTVTILKSDVDLQEIGVISNCDLDSVAEMAPKGIKETKALLARAVFGNELCTASLYRASYNDEGNKGVFKDLSSQYNRGWCTNDQITVCLDFGKNAIKFLWNGQKVKSMMRIQKGLTYYPVIAFSGNCQYRIH